MGKKVEKVSIIMPMYNEPRIKENLKEVIITLDKIIRKDLKMEYEIILVDDGSNDNSRSKAEEIKNKRLIITGYKNNIGKGNALKYGFGKVSNDSKYVAFMDSGMELHPEQLKRFIEKITETKADVVIGSKRMKGAIVHYPLTRRIMSMIYQLMVKILFGLKVKDTQVGMKLFKKEVLDKVFPKIIVKRYAFDIELLVNANKEGKRIIEIPIRLDYKFDTRIGIKPIKDMIIDTLAIFYRLRIIKYYDRK